MGSAWGVLFVLGLAVPLLLAVATCWFVLRWARELARAGGTRHPPWHFMVGHLALIAVSEVGVGSALGLLGAPMAWSPLGLASPWIFVVPAYLFFRVRRTRRSSRVRVPGVSGGGGLTHGRPWGLAAFFVVSGTLIPWATGLGVKIYLDAHGQPTLPVAGFLSPSALPVLLLLTVAMWAFPFAILASAVVVPWRVGFGSDPAGRESKLPIWLAYVAGAVTEMVIFKEVFWEFDALMLVVPVGAMLIPPMAIAYAVGWWILRRRRRHVRRPGPSVPVVG